jgi:hypothetical protein
VAIAAALITVAAAGHAFGIAEMRSLLQNIRRRVRAAP